MNNFFSNSSDYDLFKKALRSTKNEPVIINIYSDDSSLREDGDASSASQGTQRKQMSSKFQASPFDKFFGPRKKRTDPLDMKDFSAWKNKNYRESEKQIDNTPEEVTKFSFSDYLNSKTKDKRYNSEDEIKSDNQKPIDQMSTSDENYKKFSLDSYLNKLEQQTKAKKDFAQTDDLISDFVDYNSNSEKSNQDENFASSSDVGIEDIAFGGEIRGEKFSFDREELDSVKARLEKMERERNNIKDKPTTKVISSNELTDIAKGDEEDDEFNLDKLGIEDDIERVNDKLDAINKVLQVTGDDETTTPKVEGHKFVEVNKSFEYDKESNKNSESESSESLGSADNKLGSGASITVSVNGKDGVDGGVSTSSDSEGVSLGVKDMSKNAKTDSNGASTIVIGGSYDNADGAPQAGVVKPVVIVGSTANPSELAESKEPAGDNFVDAVEMTEMVDADSAGQGDMISIGGNLPQQNEIKKTDDLLTKTDFMKFTDEIVSKFSEMNQVKHSRGENYGEAGFDNPYMAGYAQPYAEQGLDFGAEQSDTNQTNVVGVAAPSSVNQEFQRRQDELQAQLMELIEQNKRTDAEVAKKLEMAEQEKLRVAEEYENRLRELEESMLEREEAVKQQAYIEKLKNDIKFKKSENKFKLREEQIRESEKFNSQILLDSEKLKSELRNSLSESNLEMDKKLLECVNKLHKAEIVKHEQKVEELEQELKEEIEKPKPRQTTRRRTTTVRSRMRTRSPRRKIDSDIIGGINFD